MGRRERRKGILVERGANIYFVRGERPTKSWSRPFLALFSCSDYGFPVAIAGEKRPSFFLVFAYPLN